MGKRKYKKWTVECVPGEQELYKELNQRVKLIAYASLANGEEIVFRDYTNLFCEAFDHGYESLKAKNGVVIK